MRKIIIFLISILIFSCSIPEKSDNNSNSQQSNSKEDDNFVGYRKETIGEDSLSWTNLTKNAQFSAREGHMTIEHNGKLWLVAGHDNNFHNDVWCSDDGSIWYKKKKDTEGSNPFLTRREHELLSYDNKLWVIGGLCWNGSNTVLGRDVWYSENGIDWTLAIGSAPWMRRAGHAGVVFDGKMWIMGGWTKNETTGTFQDANDVWYSTDGINWTEATSSAGWTGRRDTECVVFDGKMWLLGGLQNKSSTYTGLCNDAWYSTDGINWVQATSNLTVFTRARIGTAVYDNKLWVIGGLIQDDIFQWNEADSPESNVSNEVFYTSDGINWTEVENTPWAKRASLSVINFNNKLLIIGGSQSYITAWFNDVWKYEEE